MIQGLLHLTVTSLAIVYAVERSGVLSRDSFRRPVELYALTPKEKLEIRQLLDDKGRAEKTAYAFFAARTPEERSKLVRHPEITAPRMKARPDLAVEPAKVQLSEQWESKTLGETRFVMTIVTLPDTSQRSIAVEMPRSGEPLVDWEFYTGWSEVKWEDFTELGSVKPLEFRVWLKRDDYYNYAFNDKEEIACYSLTWGESDARVFGYCDRRGPVARSIEEALQALRRSDGNEKPPALPCILTLRLDPQHAKRRQAIIESFVTKGWLRREAGE